MAKNVDDPELTDEGLDWDEVDVGDPVDLIAARIANNEPGKWTGSVWGLRRRRGIRVLAWVGLVLLAASFMATVGALMIQLAR